MLMVANWKMNMDRDAIVSYLDVLSKEGRWARWCAHGYRLLLAPPYPYLDFLMHELRERELPFWVVAQNMCAHEKGAYTGEVSADMLRDLALNGVILGHSERRRLFGETDAHVAAKAALALSRELVPIVCFGETEEERQSKDYPRVWERQIAPVWKEVQKARASGSETPVYFAYEPVWAIGTGRTATLDDIREVAWNLRETFGHECSSGLLYGGSVNDESLSVLVEKGTVYGFLVGGAFLDPEIVLRSFHLLFPHP